MDIVFTFADDYNKAGKGNRRARQGPRGFPGQTYSRTLDGNIKTPNIIARQKLIKYLTKRGLKSSEAYNQANIIINSDQIRFMNMNVFGEVIMYHRNRGYSTISIDDIRYNDDLLQNHIDILIPDEIKKDKIKEEIVRLRLAATFVRYSRYLQKLRDDIQRAADLAAQQQQFS